MKEMSLGRVMVLTAHKFRLILEDALREYEISPAQYSILNALREEGRPISGRALAGALYVRAQTVTQLVNTLEKRGLISRAPHPTHGRIIENKLTVGGVAMWQKCSPRVRAVERSMLKHLDTGAANACIETLSAILDQMMRAYPGD